MLNRTYNEIMDFLFSLSDFLFGFILLLSQILFVALMIFLLFKRRELGFLKHRHYAVLGLLSLAWWLFLVIDQLNTDLICTPDDEFCNRGNTFWGDVSWGSMLAILSLVLVWAPAIFTSYYFQVRKKKYSKAP